MKAITDGHEEVVKALLTRKDIDLNLVEKDGGLSALMLCKGKLKLIKDLLAKKADPNVQDSNGMTLLMHASKHGRTKVVKELVRRANVDLGLLSKDGKSALDLAFESERAAIIKMLKDTIEAKKKREEKKNLKTTAKNLKKEKKKTHVESTASQVEVELPQAEPSNAPTKKKNKRKRGKKSKKGATPPPKEPAARTKDRKTKPPKAKTNPRVSVCKVNATQLRNATQLMKHKFNDLRLDSKFPLVAPGLLMMMCVLFVLLPSF